MEQVASLRRLTYDEGKAKGLSVVEVKTGTGLVFQVLVDKGLDLGLCEYQGLPIALRTPVGEVGPQFFEPRGDGWLRSFGGGLLVTCGLTNVGSPNQDQGEELGLHGRIHNTPGEQVCLNTAWEGDQYVLTVSGKVRQAKALGESISLQREIRAVAGESRISIVDLVTNEGFEPVPHMILYHLNIGHPLLTKGTVLQSDSLEVLPRDEIASDGLESSHLYQDPTPGFPDTVFYHRLQADSQGWCQVALVNRHLDLSFVVRYDQNNLPHFVQWKYTGQGTYAAGLEPSNCWVGGRSQERSRGTLIHLDPGETKEYRLEIEIRKGAALY